MKKEARSTRSAQRRQPTVQEEEKKEVPQLIDESKERKNSWHEEEISANRSEKSAKQQMSTGKIEEDQDSIKDSLKSQGNEDSAVPENQYIEFVPLKRDFFKGPLQVSGQRRLELEKMILECEKKKMNLAMLEEKQETIQQELNNLRSTIGKKIQAQDPETKRMTHWDYVLKEMVCMAEDFERETKKKKNDLKRNVKICKKALHDKQLQKEQQKKQEKLDLKKKAQTMSKMVQVFWKSAEKVVKHNYTVMHEQEKQQAKKKKLDQFVQKHLKLSVRVAQQLNTNAYFEESKYKEEQRDRNKSKLAKRLAVVVEKKEDWFEVDQEETTRLHQEATMEDQKLMSQKQEQEEQGQKEGQDSQVQDAVFAAQQFQPLTVDLQEAKVQTQVPFLLKGTLREYQIIGLDWLVALHNRKLNGILADEMGLGKTIQTISLLASLACDRGVWGPHLIVVPTTIIINWEMEFKKFCPALKILTYFGSQKERKMKRAGWSKEGSFHVCITSYKLVIQDHFAFRRKKWYYMILDEAQNIKNFRSQRWQTLLKFNTRRRLLLTGTPLQNDVMELWSLMHFLMPNIFSSMSDFKEWFHDPTNASINQQKGLNLEVIQNLQSILRPFILRRMKKDVEKQLPEKVEHIIVCNLSRRQRFLYDEYINMDKTQESMSNKDFFSMMNVLMHLRKVCNHPDLFEPRTIESPFLFNERPILDQPYQSFKGLQEQKRKKLDFSTLPHGIQATVDKVMSKMDYETKQELFPFKSLQSLFNKVDLEAENLSNYLRSCRPQGDGLSLARYTPQATGSLLKKENTKKLQKSLKNALINESGIQHKVPGYLNVADLPFMQNYYGIQGGNGRFREFKQLINDQNKENSKPSSIFSEEEGQQKMLQVMRRILAVYHADLANRRALEFMKPVYGEDLRKACKVEMVFDGVYHAKPYKYIDRNSLQQQKNLKKITSTILNPLCSQAASHTGIQIQEIVEEDQNAVEQTYNLKHSRDRLITLVPKSVKRKKKIEKKERERLKLIGEAEKIKKELEEIQVRKEKQFETIRSIKKVLTLVVDMGQAKRDPKGRAKDCIKQEYLEETKERKVQVERKETSQTHELKLKQQYEEIQKQLNQQKQKYEPMYQKVYSNTSKRFKSTEPDQMEVEPKTEVLEKEVIEEEKKEEENKEKEEEVKKEEEEEELPPVITEQNFIDSSDDEIQEEPLEDMISVGYKSTDLLRSMVQSWQQRSQSMETVIKYFNFYIPKALAKTPQIIPSKVFCELQKEEAYRKFAYQKLMKSRAVKNFLTGTQPLYFPHKNLVQYDSGKLQRLAELLKQLKQQGSKVLIFTQMTRMLNVLENFLNLHGHTYVRLDGSVKVEARQKMVERFNRSPKLFCFISSTRCGGIGINLTGANCVVFYDTDWNPAMDKQAQDRCHRIGQNKTVHIYRLISKDTIEVNIFKKSLQKREISGLIIEGQFDAKHQLKEMSVSDILGDAELFKAKRFNVLEEDKIFFQADDLEQEENYRKKFEEALVQIEDKEDVQAAKMAAREIQDEFEENQLEQTEAKTEKEEGKEEGKQVEDEEEKAISQQKALFLLKVYIDYLNHESLDDVTKKCIEHFERNYSYQDFKIEKESKDTKFAQQKEEEEEKRQKEEEEKGKGEDGEGSEFSLSGAESDLERTMESWDRSKAEVLYRQMEEELQNHCL